MIDDYIEMKYGQIWAVKCKGCGVTIKQMSPHDQPIATEKINGRTLVRERMVLMPLADYREVLIEFDDGSKHVTPMCASCATKMEGNNDMQSKVYYGDMKQWHKEGLRTRREDAIRTPVSVLKIADHISGE